MTQNAHMNITNCIEAFTSGKITDDEFKNIIKKEVLSYTADCVKSNVKQVITDILDSDVADLNKTIKSIMQYYGIKK